MNLSSSTFFVWAESGFVPIPSVSAKRLVVTILNWMSVPPWSRLFPYWSRVRM